MPSTIRYKPGDIVLVRFPFTDFSSQKKRPALVLSTPAFTARYGDVVLIALTSQPQREANLKISRWRLAGLPKPTWIKPTVGTFASALILRRLGRLHVKDRSGVRVALHRAIAGTFL